jgi:uncharacterized phage-associated protein
MDAKRVADYLIYKSSLEEEPITNLKLQKLLYYSQGFYLAIYNKVLFEDLICKWTHGPVVPNVYHQFKSFGSNPITPINDFDVSDFSSDELSLINDVYSVYGQFSGSALRNMTHIEPPWADTEDAEEIPVSLMDKYFKTRLVKK